ncbi:MAG: sulfatase [Candidatus Krumholzibacteria bacterium]|nr:sulfatase [Candidatus Krumholzibacteria bacterium]
MIFVSFDTARKDHFGCYGNPWIRTPRIDALAAESILFTDYMTVVPTTLASHTSLFTGKYAHTHGTPRNGFMVNEENVMLAEILKDAGFHTAGFAASFPLSSRFAFAQGFDHYDEDFETLPDVGARGQPERDARAVTDAAIAYLKAQGVPERLFLFLHYFDAHAPYAPPPSYAAPYAADPRIPAWLEAREGPWSHEAADTGKALRYAGEMTAMDEHFGRVLDYLDARGVLDEAIVVVTSDHGENFWGHFRPWDHGNTVYQSTVDAICMIRLPGALHGGTRIEPLFASIDVLPSVLSYLDLPVPPGIDGEAVDLTAVPIALGPRTRFSQATKPHERVETDPRWTNIRKAACVREGNWKYAFVPFLELEELFDLAADPFEQRNLLVAPTAEEAKRAIQMREVLERWVQSAAPLASEFEWEHRADTERKLRALGYLR